MSGIITHLPRVLGPESRPHQCRALLPHNTGGYGSTGYPDDTLIQCPSCFLWWMSVPFYGSLGPTSHWIKVRWYHRNARARIRLVEK